MAPVAPLHHSGDSANIAYYVQEDPLGIWASVLRSDHVHGSGTAVRRSRPVFRFTLHRDGNMKFADFTYEPLTKPAPGPLSGRTVTRLIRQHLAGGSS